MSRFVVYAILIALILNFYTNFLIPNYYITLSINSTFHNIFYLNFSFACTIFVSEICVKWLRIRKQSIVIFLSSTRPIAVILDRLRMNIYRRLAPYYHATLRHLHYQLYGTVTTTVVIVSLLWRHNVPPPAWHHNYHHGTTTITMTPQPSPWHHNHHQHVAAPCMAPSIADNNHTSAVSQ